MDIGFQAGIFQRASKVANFCWVDLHLVTLPKQKSRRALMGGRGGTRSPGCGAVRPDAEGIGQTLVQAIGSPCGSY
jgi:hypothetical protein